MTELPLFVPDKGSGQAVHLQQISVRDIRVAADIGVHAHEMGRRQALIVAARVRLCPVTADRLTATIDYNGIVEAALALGDERIALIETFAFRLAQACLENAAVLEAEVTVEKPGALTNGLASAQVVLRRGG